MLAKELQELLPVVAAEGRMVQVPESDPDVGFGKALVESFAQRLGGLPESLGRPGGAVCAGAAAGVGGKNNERVEMGETLDELVLPCQQLSGAFRLGRADVVAGASDDRGDAKLFGLGLVGVVGNQKQRGFHAHALRRLEASAVRLQPVLGLGILET